MTDVWKNSPYSGTQRLIHLALADSASDEGHCWPSKETIARKAACSKRYVIATLKRMVEDGLLKVYWRYGKHAYQLLPVASGGEHSSPPRGEHSSPPGVNTVHPEPSVEPSVKPEPSKKPSFAPAARGEKEVVVIVGGFPDDEPVEEKKPVPKQGSAAWAEQRFRIYSDKAGHRQINVAHLRRMLKSLREKHGLSNEEIVVLMERFFIGHEDLARKAKNPVALFNGMVGSLLKETEDSRSNLGTDNDYEEYSARVINQQARDTAEAVRMVQEKIQRMKQGRSA